MSDKIDSASQFALCSHFFQKFRMRSKVHIAALTTTTCVMNVGKGQAEVFCICARYQVFIK